MTPTQQLALAHAARYRELIALVELGRLEKPEPIDALDAWTLLAEQAEEIAGAQLCKTN